MHPKDINNGENKVLHLFLEVSHQKEEVKSCQVTRRPQIVLHKI